MSVLREAVKLGLAVWISDQAPEVANDLRRSARRDPPGIVRNGKRSLARAADGLATDPTPVVNLIEFLYDQQRTGGKHSRPARWW